MFHYKVQLKLRVYIKVNDILPRNESDKSQLM